MLKAFGIDTSGKSKGKKAFKSHSKIQRDSDGTVLSRTVLGTNKQYEDCVTEEQNKKMK